jgi:hypothetical protein
VGDIAPEQCYQFILLIVISENVAANTRLTSISIGLRNDTGKARRILSGDLLSYRFLIYRRVEGATPCCVWAVSKIEFRIETYKVSGFEGISVGLSVRQKKQFLAITY